MTPIKPMPIKPLPPVKPLASGQSALVHPAPPTNLTVMLKP
jgi:hypothetical protein